jgi:hypothetical protein
VGLGSSLVRRCACARRARIGAPSGRPLRRKLCSQLRESCGCSSGGGARLLHVLGHHVHRPAELLGRAELDHLGSGEEDRRVPRPDIVSVAGLEDLLGWPTASLGPAARQPQQQRPGAYPSQDQIPLKSGLYGSRGLPRPLRGRPTRTFAGECRSWSAPRGTTFFEAGGAGQRL